MSVYLVCCQLPPGPTHRGSQSPDFTSASWLLLSLLALGSDKRQDVFFDFSMLKFQHVLTHVNKLYIWYWCFLAPCFPNQEFKLNTFVHGSVGDITYIMPDLEAMRPGVGALGGSDQKKKSAGVANLQG